MYRQLRSSAPGEAIGASRSARAILPVLAVLSAAIVQLPVLGSFFRGDDFLHLYDMIDHGWLQFAVTTNGGHLLITSNLAFYLCHALFGLHAEMYYGVAWLTHLVNVYLLYRVVEISTERPVLAFVPALLWGISGLAQEPLGWFSVYGHVLVATFTLWFLAEVAQVGRGQRDLTGWTLARWMVLLLLGATSFGTGIPIAMLSGPVVYLMLAGRPERLRAALWLGSLVLLIPAVYFATLWIYTQMNVGSGAGLSYGSYVDLLKPTNWWPTLSMFELLFAYGVANLLLGPLMTARADGVTLGPLAGASLSAVAVVCAVLSAVVLAACVVALRRASKEDRQRLAGYAILAVGAYGMVALARGYFYGLFKTPLTVAAVQPRYHYVPQALIAILLALEAAKLPRLRPRPGWWRSGAAALALLAMVGLGRVSSRVVYGMMGPDGRASYEETVLSIRDAIAAGPPGSEVRIENRFFPGAGPLSRPFFAGTAALFVIVFPGNEVDGRRVHFVERDPERRLEWVERIPGTRLSELLVAPRPGE